MSLRDNRRKWHRRHARVRLAAATSNWDDIDRFAGDLERELEGSLADGDGQDECDAGDDGLGVSSADDEDGG